MPATESTTGNGHLLPPHRLPPENGELRLFELQSSAGSEDKHLPVFATFLRAPLSFRVTSCIIYTKKNGGNDDPCSGID